MSFHERNPFPIDEPPLLSPDDRPRRCGHFPARLLDIAGAALDVHAREGENEISALATLSNVILTPHMGAMTVDSQRAVGERVIEIVQNRA